MTDAPVIVIGAGHNGLTAAFYLARAGFKTLVLERRPTVGGAAITGEIAPGFRGPTLAHCVGPLRPAVMRDMKLARGVEFVAPNPRLICLSRDGRPLPLSTDVARTATAIRSWSEADAGGLYGVRRDAGAARRVHLRTPRRHAAIARRARARRALGSPQDRTTVPRPGAGRRIQAAALDADGRGGSRRRAFHDRASAGGNRGARHHRRVAGTAVGRHRRGAAHERGARSGARRQLDRRQGRARGPDGGDGGRCTESRRRDPDRRRGLAGARPERPRRRRRSRRRQRNRGPGRGVERRPEAHPARPRQPDRARSGLPDEGAELPLARHAAPRSTWRSPGCRHFAASRVRPTSAAESRSAHR